jgi:hypothetical protein
MLQDKWESLESTPPRRRAHDARDGTGGPVAGADHPPSCPTQGGPTIRVVLLRHHLPSHRSRTKIKITKTKRSVAAMTMSWGPGQSATAGAPKQSPPSPRPPGGPKIATSNARRGGLGKNHGIERPIRCAPPGPLSAVRRKTSARVELCGFCPNADLATSPWLCYGIIVGTI